jgi:prepilin-type N-terminal cleavage/methylation domain-containing protein
MHIQTNRSKERSGFTLVESIIASAIAAMMFGGIIYGYTRACKWDPESTPAVDELVSGNFPTLVSILDVPMNGSNIVYATNFTTISTISTTPKLRMISVESVWGFINGRTYTNSIATCRAPDA